MNYSYTGEEFVKFQARVLREGGSMSEVNHTPEGDGLSVEFPSKPPYKEIHEEVHDTKPALGFRGEFYGTESKSEASEEDEIRDPKNPTKTVEYNLVKIDADKFAVFGNGSIVKIPLL